MNKWSELIREVNLSEVDLNTGKTFYKSVISNSEYKIQKIAEWDLQDDKNPDFSGYSKPKLTLTPEGETNVNDYKNTVVYFFVVEETCLYIGQSSNSFKTRMGAYASAGRTSSEKGFAPSGQNKGGGTNMKINKKVTSFKLTNKNDTIKIYSAYYAVPERIQLLPNNGDGLLSGEFDIVIPPTKVEKYFLTLYNQMEGNIPQWQGKID
jgi:hypothetical protein